MLAYSCAAARELHPLPCPRSIAKRLSGTRKSKIEKDRSQKKIGERTLSFGYARVNRSFRLLADAIERGLQMSVPGFERKMIGAGRNVEQPSALNVRMRKWLGDDEAVPGIERPAAIHRDVKAENWNMRIAGQ